MATEPIRTYRLFGKGEPGLTCDAEGVALGGVPLVSASAHADGGSRWQVRRRDEIGDILELGYGRQERTLGVSIETFPDTPLGTPNAPPTAEEQRQFDQESAVFAEGKRKSEQSWSGRVTTGAVFVATALPFLALAPAVEDAAVEGPLNSAEELWPRGSEVIAADGARPTVQGNAYEIGIRGLYPETTAEARRFGEFGQYKADAVADVFGKWTAIDAKYADEWGSSIRNPESAIGDKPFSIEAQQEMVDQAKRYDEYFDGGSIYHTNSLDLASYYYRLFRASGVTKARFIITPAGP